MMAIQLPELYLFTDVACTTHITGNQPCPQTFSLVWTPDHTVARPEGSGIQTTPRYVTQKEK